jgi:cupin fold WbuC family metalloprotein
MVLVVFDDSGEIAEKVIFGTGSHGVDACGVDVPNGCWHTVIALDPGSVLLEVKAGPFDPTQAKNFASWAPEEGTVAAREYAEALRRSIAA